ncbi:MAG: hypothetical protein KGI54_15450 [Pseudomonadota bacterium]|nr:hypothetical protein [Pseudomonadota bacterium]
MTDEEYRLMKTWKKRDIINHYEALVEIAQKKFDAQENEITSLIAKLAPNNKAEGERLNNAYNKGYKDGYLEAIKDTATPVVDQFSTGPQIPREEINVVQEQPESVPIKEQGEPIKYYK